MSNNTNLNGRLVPAAGVDSPWQLAAAKILDNTAGLTQWAVLFKLRVAPTTAGGGGHGPIGPLTRLINDAFTDEFIIDREGCINAMDYPRFATAVAQGERPKVILSGSPTDFCLAYPAMSLVAAATTCSLQSMLQVPRTSPSTTQRCGE